MRFLVLFDAVAITRETRLWEARTMKFSLDISAGEIVALFAAKAECGGLTLTPENSKVIDLTPVWGGYCMSLEGQQEALANADIISGLVATFEITKPPPIDDTQH
jgi:hypothetical protein